MFLVNDLFSMELTISVLQGDPELYFCLWVNSKLLIRMEYFFIYCKTQVNASLMTSVLMGLYLVFLCWSALRSEPTAEICNTRSQAIGGKETGSQLS